MLYIAVQVSDLGGGVENATKITEVAIPPTKLVMGGITEFGNLNGARSIWRR
ncbi:MAG: hypothetical protein HPY61_02985 [Methanotrichaceae archaeon]|nr:hypothetical protein [Methanotrichaceae archaeon]